MAYYFQIADGLSPDPRIYTENRATIGISEAIGYIYYLQCVQNVILLLKPETCVSGFFYNSLNSI
jgi:hypothetical protein